MNALRYASFDHTLLRVGQSQINASEVRFMLQMDPFPVLLPGLTTGLKDKELAEFRSLLQTVFSCLKSVLYCMVAFHTNRGLQAPVGCLQAVGPRFATCCFCMLTATSASYC